MGKIEMQVIKFVTKDFKSPGDYGKLDYSKFGIPIEVKADPKEYGQCAKGIHVVPISEDVNFEKVIFTGTMILLEVSEEDIVYCGKNGKMRVRKATPIRQVVESDEEWKIIRKAACKRPCYAYMYAKNVDKNPTDETKTAASRDPYYAYWYVKYVDKNPTDKIRTAVCKEPVCAYEYARDVDKKPTDETRTAACKKLEYAYYYARDVDKKPTDETRTVACKSPCYAYMYARDVDQKSTDETRTAACKEPGYAYRYAIAVDKEPTAETRTAALKNLYWGNQYEQWEKEQCK
jgi:hypothetical protein